MVVNDGQPMVKEWLRVTVWNNHNPKPLFVHFFHHHSPRFIHKQTSFTKHCLQIWPWTMAPALPTNIARGHWISWSFMVVHCCLIDGQLFTCQPPVPVVSCGLLWFPMVVLMVRKPPRTSWWQVQPHDRTPVGSSRTWSTLAFNDVGSASSQSAAQLLNSS